MVRAFLYWCMEKGYLEKYPIRLVRADDPIKEPYTTDELQKLLKEPDCKTCSFAEYRNWVIVNFLLGTGCRLGYFHGNYSYYHRQHYHYCGNYHRPDGTCSCGNQGGRKRCSGSGGSADTATHAPADSCSQGNDGSPKGNHRTADQGSCHDYQGGCFT